ncbi:bifunctional 3,4-dihydroxy-2-butanone 4-phosphate synthase/GTP cyclohydrolase II [Campylobacter canadensis]|uniref:3,4-dihydroxy-2-butanone 4-phosphate synthase n=1 Tax=Campylobacter canadensis TaxID=449520 RepID=A0ABS7WS48_9BACT|nr:bifunctional 3,4-dihydroxy-2-butanone 4-phosphate synthase/GTP cyclohydrolase II [Campylobacter canadensis]MBZ7987580.1 bifunctional 3,4-dihydroxy-2-butanone 4-phosphate synthase/GTP cyclohydrolase II [Campylobacter canadensis]MBZ7998664.1 bifunctional 3,4-dihydroxy-2-butanone 4-phosphate synthase/GTP cyclohydrolase II [Campylobacter canadensis]
MSFISIEEGIKQLQNGQMLIMLDAPDRENEGDLIFAAQFCTAEKINFTLSKARGVVCVALDSNLANKFNLPLMVPKNTSNHETAFTITVDAKTATTGVSAQERCDTIKIFADKNASESDFVRPGHINPLIAKDGGVLVRTGHTEGTVDMCKLANLTPACVICEIMNEDGTMARQDDLIKFGEKHNIKLVTIEDLIKFRLKTQTLINLVSKENTNILDKAVLKLEFSDFLNRSHFVFIFDGKYKNSLVKFYKSSQDAIKFEDSINAINELCKNGGILILMQGEKSDDKNYGIGAQILKYLGVKSFSLLSNNQTQLKALSGFDLDIKFT